MGEGDYPQEDRRKEGSLIAWRLGQVEKEIDEKAGKDEMQALKESLRDLKEEVAGLRKVLIAAAISWAAGSGAFLLAVLELAR